MTDGTPTDRQPQTPLEFGRAVDKLRKINDALMKRVERSMDQQANAFSLFQTAINQETQIRIRLGAELVRARQDFDNQIHGWSVVLFSLAGTVLLVGGVGVLSVMLISFSDRRYEIGLRKAMGADDHQILVQFLLEAVVLAAIGASIGTLGGSALCRALSDKFPWGLVVNPYGLAAAWAIALALALVFGLYPAVRAARLSPMEAMR